MDSKKKRGTFDPPDLLAQSLLFLIQARPSRKGLEVRTSHVVGSVEAARACGAWPY